LRIAVLLCLLLFSNAAADWYILLPKTVREKAKKESVKKVKKGREKVEVRRVACPDFTITTPDLKGVSISDFRGRKVIIVLFRGAFNADTEMILKEVDGIDGAVSVAIDADESEFPLLRDLERKLGIRSVYLSADSYLVEQLRKKIGFKKLPVIIFVDRYGFIRLYSDSVASAGGSLRKELKSALSSIP